MLHSNPLLVCLADQFADHNGCLFWFFKHSAQFCWHSAFLLCHHLTHLPAIFDAESMFCHLKLNITTNFFAGPIFHCHSQCPSSYPLNSTPLTDSCAICYMFPELQVLASTRKQNVLRRNHGLGNFTHWTCLEIHYNL